MGEREPLAIVEWHSNIQCQNATKLPPGSCKPSSARCRAGTLWGFILGFWDIWESAALPRWLMTEALDSDGQSLVLTLAVLYQQRRTRVQLHFLQ